MSRLLKLIGDGLLVEEVETIVTPKERERCKETTTNMSAS